MAVKFSHNRLSTADPGPAFSGRALEPRLSASRGRSLVVGLSQVRPSQATIGVVAAEAKLRGWRHDAQAQDLDFRAHARRGLQHRFLVKPRPAVLDCEGHIRITDGHHKLWALSKIEKSLDVDFLVSVEIVYDFRELDLESFRRAMASLYPVSGVSEAERVSMMADSFEALRDDPVRSLVGLALKSLGIRSKMLRPYAQFSLCRALRLSATFKQRMAELGLLQGDGSLQSGAPSSEAAVDVVRELFTLHRSMNRLVSELAKDSIAKDLIEAKLEQQFATQAPSALSSHQTLRAPRRRRVTGGVRRLTSALATYSL